MAPVSDIITWVRLGTRLPLRLHRAPIPEEEPLPGDDEDAPDHEEPPPHPDPEQGRQRGST